MDKKITNGKMNLIKGDITELKVDAIVNAANSALAGGSGVDGAIHGVGGREIYDECMKIVREQGYCHTGQAVITTGGKLQAKYVIHTVGPIWNGGEINEDELLADCYKNSLRIAVENAVRTIAFPNISTGIYGYPKGLAAQIAIKTVSEFLLYNSDIEEVIFVCFDYENFRLYSELLNKKID